MKLFRTLVILFAVSGVVGTVYAQDSPSKFGGEIRALNYAYGVAPNTPALTVDMPNGPSTAGATSTITLVNGTVKLSDGVVIAPLAVGVPVIIGTGSNADTVTPTSVNCSTPTVVDSCSFTATSITHAHGTGDRVTSATVGLAEAVAYATTLGGVDSEALTTFIKIWRKLTPANEEYLNYLKPNSKDTVVYLCSLQERQALNHHI